MKKKCTYLLAALLSAISGIIPASAQEQGGPAEERWKAKIISELREKVCR
jgi:hypothetical protein